MTLAYKAGDHHEDHSRELFLIIERKVIMTFVFSLSFFGSFNFLFIFLIEMNEELVATVYGVVGLIIFGGLGDLVCQKEIVSFSFDAQGRNSWFNLNFFFECASDVEKKKEKLIAWQ